MRVIISSTGLVDFNSVEEDGTVVVPLRRLRGLVPSPGQFLTLEDFEGHSCLATMEAVDPRGVIVRPHWDSWVQASDETFHLVIVSSPATPAPIQRDLPVPPVRTGQLSAAAHQ
jgi:hypothetical protein